MASGKKIIIVNGEKNSATILYRSHAAERCLKKLGLVINVHEVDEINNVSLEEVTACLFIRTPLTPTVRTFIERLKSLGVVVLADFDDLIFRPELLYLFDGINYLSNSERELFIERASQFQEMVKIADYIIVTTLPLANQAIRFNKQVKIIKNYPLEITRNASILTKNKKCNADKFIIGYYSGTLTHQADFRQCASVLANLMKKYNEVELRIVGKMEMNEFAEFEAFGARVKKIPLMTYMAMLSDLQGCDLNIAPLERDNVFCECKSELKYFDAALMCIPTIASPTIPFKSAIRNGVNGYLADTEQDWTDCLEGILKNREVVNNVGLNARRYALSFFGEAAQLNDYRKLVADMLIN